MADTSIGDSRATALRSIPSPALRLVAPAPRPPCAKTVAFIERLLEEARAGCICGVALVVALPGRGYRVDTCGELRDSPTYARGAVAALDDELRELVRESAQ